MRVSRLLLFAAAAVLAQGHAARAAPDEQFIPANITAEGPVTPARAATSAGMIDYLDLVNRRDGGINGVKFAWDKCDSNGGDRHGADSQGGARGFECYERAKSHRP